MDEAGSRLNLTIEGVEEETAHIVAPVKRMVGQLYRNILRANRYFYARYGIEIVTPQVRVSEE